MEGIHIDWDNWVVSIEDTIPLDTMAKFLFGMGEDHGWEIRICKGVEYGIDENPNTTG